MLLGCYAPDETAAVRQAAKYVQRLQCYMCSLFAPEALFARAFLAVNTVSFSLLVVCTETHHASSDSCQQELEGLLQQAAAPDGHISFDQRSGGETWEQNVRRIATDVVCLG